MAKSTQSCRIEQIFGIPRTPAFRTFTPTGQPLTVMELELSPGNGCPRHSPSHDDAYLVITNVGASFRLGVVRGISTTFVAVVPPGGTIVIDLAEPFDVSWSGPLHAVAAYLPRHAIFDGRKDCDRRSIVDNALLDDDLLGAIMACLRHTAPPSQPDDSDVFSRQLLAAVCSCLARSHSVLTSEPRIVGLMLTDKQKKTAIDCILSNLDSTLSMQEVASACGLPYRLFNRAFKLSLGASPHDWAMATRIAHAKELMKDSSLRLSDIALNVGFCDQSHFNRVFVRFSACTPGEWRRHQEAKEAIGQRESA
jgi:AraC-like DNA-binding protein